MKEEALPGADRIAASFQRLAGSATNLNSVSDDLGRHITKLDGLIRDLNLGIEGWVEVVEYGDPAAPEEYETHELGYAKVRSKWGIALRVRTGSHNSPGDDSCETWLFNDAPRAMRVKAVAKIPQLLDRLADAADATAKKIGATVGVAEQVVSAVAAATPQRRK